MSYKATTTLPIPNKAECTRAGLTWDGTPLTREILEEAYWGSNPSDPAGWRSLQDSARQLNASYQLVREKVKDFGLHLRTPRENFRKIIWHGQMSRKPWHYSNLESLARDVLLKLGFTIEVDVLHNHYIDKCWADFYFPEHKAMIEIDSVWHKAWWRKYDRGDKDKARDERLTKKGLRVVRIDLSDTSTQIAHEKIEAALRHLNIPIPSTIHEGLVAI